MKITQNSIQTQVQKRGGGLSLLLLVLLALPATAANKVWNGGGADVNWGTAANWVGGIAPVTAADSITFTNTARITNFNNLVSYSNLWLEIRGTNFSIGGNAFTNAAGITNNSGGNNIISNYITLSASQTFANNSNGATLIFWGGITNGGSNLFLAGPGNFTFNAGIDGAGGLVKTNSGTTILAATNTFTGGISNGLGTLQIGAGGATGDLGTNYSTVTNNSTLVFNFGYQITNSFTNTITGTGPIFLSGNSNVVVWLSGTNTFTGSITNNSGGLGVRNSSSLGWGTKTVSLANGTTGWTLMRLDGSGGDITLSNNISFITSWANGTVYNDAGNNTIAGNFTLAGGGGDTYFIVSNGTLNLSGTLSPNTTLRYLKLGGPTNGTVSGVIADGGGVNTLAVNKVDAGTWTLGGTNTYTGNTVIGAGRLVLATNGSNGKSAYILANGGVFDVSAVPGGFCLSNNQALGGNGGVVTGSVTALPGSFIVPGNDGTAGTYTITNSLTMNNGSGMRYDLSTTATNMGGGVNDLLVVSNLTLLGKINVNFSFMGKSTPLTNTYYTLIAYRGTLIGNAGNLTAPAGYGATFDDSAPGLIRVKFSAAIQRSLVWKGDGVQNTWDLGLTTNWLNGGLPDVFYGGDTVLFDNSGSNNPAINLGASLAPAAIIVNSSNNYTFASNGVIASGSLTKLGAGTLYMTNVGANLYNGGTFVGGGTLKVGVANSMGANASSVVATNGGQVDVNGVDQSAKGFTYTVNGVGPDGQGAIKSTAGSLDGAKSGIKNVIMTGDTVFGGTARFDLASGGYMNGNGYRMIKVGTSTVPFRGTVSNISEIVVSNGTLYGEATTQMQMTNLVSVYPGGTLAAYAYDGMVGLTNSTRVNLYGGILGGGGASANSGHQVWIGPIYVYNDSAMNATALSAGSDTRLDGPINGSAMLNVRGNSTRAFILTTNNNTYSGNWTIESTGVLRLTNSATPGTGIIYDNGSLELANTNAYTLSNNVIGTGAMSIRATNGVTFDGTASVNLTGVLQVGAVTNYGKATFNSGANVSVGQFTVGNPTSIPGDVIHNGGAVTVSGTLGLRVGHWPTEISTYTMNGGTLSIPNGPLSVGWDGVGLFNLNGGTVGVLRLSVDDNGNTGALGGTNETFTLSGGRINLGAGGITTASTDGGYRIALGGGTLGAWTNWSSSAAIVLTNAPGTVSIDPSGNTITLSGSLSGPGGFSKDGPGTLTVSGNTLYQGNATLNNGVLLVNGVLGTNNSGAINVTAGTLAGTGVLRAPVTINGGTLSAGAVPGAGTLTVSNSVVFNGGSMLIDLTNNATGLNDLVDIKNDLTLNANVPVAFNFLTNGPALGTAYTIAKFGGVFSGSGSFVNASHYSGTISVATPNVQITFTGGNSNLTWRGDGAANVWQANTTPLNWWNGAALDFFGAGDVVTFDGSGSNNVPVNLVGVVTPSNITVNAGIDYVLTGSGRIAGSASLNKSGTGMLTISNAHEFTGNTIISGGTVSIGLDSSLGVIPAAATPGKIQINGGTLQAYDTFILNANRGIYLGPSSGSGTGTIKVLGTNIVAYSGIITSNGTSLGGLIKTGPGQLTLSGYNTYLNGTTVSEGTLALGVGGGTGTIRNNLIVQPGATVVSLVNDAMGYTTGLQVTNITINGGSVFHASTLNLTLSGITINMTGGNFSATNGGGRLDLLNNGTLYAVVNTYASSTPSVIGGTNLYLRQATNLFTVADGSLGNDLVVAAPINETAAGMGIYKAGPGVMTLQCTNFYSGPTFINAGKLALGSNASLSNSPNITLASGATFDVSAVTNGFVLNTNQTLNASGTVVGRLTIASNATVSPGGSLVAGTLVVSSNLTLNNGSKLYWTLTNVTTVGVGVNDLINVQGDLVIAGFVTNTINQLAAQLAAGSYRLINYSGALIGAPANMIVVNGSTTNRYSYTLDFSVTNQVNLVVVGTPSALTWRGTGTNNDWTAVAPWPLDWFNGASMDRYFNGDTVWFDDSASATFVNLPGQIFPGAVTVSNSGTYTFFGAGKISGVTGVTKQGLGMLVLSNAASDFTGPIVVRAGILRIGASNAMGFASSITVNSNAQLDFFGVPGSNNVTPYNFVIAGPGPGGDGALKNWNYSTMNVGIRNLTLSDDATLNVISRIDICSAAGTRGGVVNGNGHRLTKIGGEQMPIHGTVTNLTELIINNGLVYGETAHYSLGTNVTVNTPGRVGAYGALTNNCVITMNSATLEATGSGTATWLGPLTMNGSCIFNTLGQSAGTTPQDIRYLGAIGGSGGIYKIAPAITNGNALILGGTNTYTGDTVIAGGRITMLATASISNSAAIRLGTNVVGGTNAVFDVSAFTSGYTLTNQTLGGFGIVTGSVFVADGGILLPGRENIPGTLMFSNNLTLSNAVLKIDLTNSTLVGSGTNDLLFVQGGLTLLGNTVVQLNILDTNLPVNGVFTILTNLGARTGSGTISVVANSRYTFSPTLNANSITVTYTGNSAPANLTWWGDGINNVWDLNTTPNWTNNNGTATDVFKQLDPVTFDDTGSPTPAVTLSGALRPQFITVNGTASYTFGGTGSLDGVGNLTNNSTGMLTLQTINTTLGKVVVNAGTVSISDERNLGGNPNSYIPDQLTLNGGTLAATSPLALNSTNRGLWVGANGGALAPAAGTTLTLLNPIVGTATTPGAALHKLGGSSTLILAGNNLLTNIFAIDAGYVQVGMGSNNGTLGAAITVTNNGWLTFNRGSFTITNNIVGTGMVVFAYSNLVSLGAGAPAYTVQNTGPANTWSGGTLITNSRVAAATATSMGTGPITVTTNGQIEVRTAFTNALLLNGYGCLGVAPDYRYGALRLAGGTVYGPVTLQGNTRISAYINSAGTIASAITGSYDIDFGDDNGAGGSITLSGTNSFPSATLTSVRLVMGNSNALPNAATIRMYGITNSVGGAIDLNNTTQTVARLLGDQQYSPNAYISNGTLRVTTSANDTYNGRIQLNGTLSMDGSGALTLGGNTDNVSGKVTVNSGTVILGKASSGTIRAIGGLLTVNGGLLQLSGTGGDQISSAAAAQMNGGTFDFNGRDEGWDALNGTAGVLLNNVAGTNNMVTLGQNNATSTFGGVIQDGVGTLSLSKSGTGTITLTGTNTYSGVTLVTNGNLAVNGKLAGTNAVIVGSSGGGLLGNGTVMGPVTVMNSSAISPNGSGAAGTLTLASSLTLSNNSKLNWSLTNNTAIGGNNDLLIVGGDVVIGGAVTLTIYPLTSQLAAGTYRIMNYSGNLIGNATNITVVNSVSGTHTYAIDASTPGQINLVVSAGVLTGNRVWRGYVSANWNTTEYNWFNGASNDLFNTASPVIFDDSGLLTTIAIPGTVQPGSVLVDSSKNYTLGGGNGKITGTTGITKQGAGILTLSTTNDFTGLIQVNAGILKGSCTNAFGATPMITVANGAQLDLNGITYSKSYNVTIQGFGPDGRGAVLNSVNFQGVHGGGVAQIANVTLTGDAGVGSPVVAAVWDIYGGVIDGKGYKLTKKGPGRLDFQGGCRVTNLSEYIVAEGIAYSEGTSLKDNFGSNLVIMAGAVVSPMNNYTNTGSVVLNGGTLAVGGNTDAARWRGPITLNTNSILGYYLIYNNPATYSNFLYIEGPMSGPAGFTKIGTTNTTFLTNANTYTGDTIIAEGRLNLAASGSIANSANIIVSNLAYLEVTNNNFVLSANQTLGGGGTVFGQVADSAGAFIQPGGASKIGTLTINSNLTLNGGGTLLFDLSSVNTTEGGTDNDLLNVTNLVINGHTVIKLSPISGAFVNDYYTLINYVTATFDQANLTVQVDMSGASATLDYSVPNKIRVLVTSGTPVSLTWIGDYDGNGRTNWDVNVTDSWTDGSSPLKFLLADSVLFDDSMSSGTTDANLVGSLVAGSVTVSSANYLYRFLGSGSLTTPTFGKSLANTLVLANSGLNSFGALQISGGTMILANSGINVWPTTDLQPGTTLQVGNGGFAGALPAATTIANAGALVFNRVDDLTVANVISGAGSLTKQGGGVLSLGGINPNYTGAIIVGAGTLKPTAFAAVSNASSIVVQSGATLDVNGLNFMDRQVTIAGVGLNGLGAVVNSGTLQSNALWQLTLTTNATLGVALNSWGLRSQLGTNATVKSSGQPYKLTKVGAGMLGLWDATVDPALGDIDITAGSIQFAYGTNLAGTLAGNPASNVFVRANATLDLYLLSNVFNKVVVLDLGSTLYNNVGTNIIGGPVKVNGNAFVNVATNTLVLTNDVTGAGTLTKSGGYILQIGNTNTVGTLNVPVNIASGTLQFARSDAYTYTNNIYGVGTVQQLAGSGPLTLAGATNFMASLIGQAGQNNPIILASGTTNYFSGGVYIGRNIASSLVIQTNAKVLAQYISIGDIGNVPGNVTQLGGDVIVNNSLRVAHYPTTGSYVMGGGTLSMVGIPSAVVNQPIGAEQNGIIYIGVDGTGTFIQTNGAVSAHGIVLDARNDTAGTDTYTLEGGTVILGPSGFKSGGLDTNTTYLINLGGGTVSAWSNWNSSLKMTLTGINGNTIFNPSTNTITLNGVLSGTAGLVKLGVGTLALNATNTFTGLVTVSEGGLTGNGVLVAPVTVTSGGVMSMLSGSINTFTISNNLTLAGNTVLEMHRQFTPNCDLITGISTLTLGGTLTLTNMGPAPQLGDTFKLFNAQITLGAFSTINLPALPLGSYWDTSKLTVDGTLTVVGLPVITQNPQPASLTTGVGSNATFTVTATGLLPHYQWYLNNTVPVGVDNPALALTNLQMTNNGQYSVVVYNGAGSVTSTVPATLVVTNTSSTPIGLVITPSPTNTVDVGNKAEFTATVTGGSAPIDFYWYKLPNLTAPVGMGNNYTSAVVTCLSEGDAYQVVASNLVGMATSLVTYVEVRDTNAPAFNPAVVTTNVMLPQGTNFSVAVGVAANCNLATYRWYVNATNLLASQTTPTLNLSSLKLNDAGTYTLIMSNKYGLSPIGTAAVVTVTYLVENPMVITLGTTFQTTVTAEPNRAYWLEARDSLTEGTWQFIIGVTNVTGPQVLQDAAATAGFKFYRIGSASAP
ncbi:MAG: autotransporter-associated beta strand repeat-containing protein [Verrucomicrobiota bacterium]